MVTPGDWLRGAFTPHKLKHNVIMLDAKLDNQIMTRFQIIGVKKQSRVLTELDLKLKSNHVVRGRSNR